MPYRFTSGELSPVFASSYLTFGGGGPPGVPPDIPPGPPGVDFGMLQVSGSTLVPLAY